MQTPSPLAVVLPWNCFPSQEALQIWYALGSFCEFFPPRGTWLSFEALGRGLFWVGGWLGTGAPAMLATATKTAARLDSTRFMQTPLSKYEINGFLEIYSS